MLRTVPKAARFATFLALAVALAAFAKTGGGQSPGVPSPPQTQSAQPQNPLKPPPPATSQTPTQQPAPPPPGQAPRRTIQTVVLDPAHGGTDEGAHGSTGIVEKDVTLALAQVVAARLRRDGLRVVMTRTGDQTVSFDDRAATANAQVSAIFLSLHVGSSGQVGSASAYYYDFSQIAPSGSQAAAHGLLSWELAQQPWQSYSRRLAQLLQAELSARFRGSPDLPSGAAIYQLRELNEPAVAVEIENVNAPNADALQSLAAPLAISISRAIQSFRTVYAAEMR
ncbi:MAG: N-acetylmuramoyl-L-alanine amidase [Acidobacteriota bacterium]|nr:N-acetylmuramoyl-L-alanine amidase [Acidobacteriota bacterium]